MIVIGFAGFHVACACAPAVIVAARMAAATAISGRMRCDIEPLLASG
jgi:hypothetical protein